LSLNLSVVRKMWRHCNDLDQGATDRDSLSHSASTMLI
jgi:hypothetical protein